MTNISNIRDELVTLIDEVEKASLMRTGAVFAFIPSFITSARVGVERIDEGLANVLAEDGTTEDFDRREALNHINDFIESFRSIYSGTLTDEALTWLRWSHEDKLADFYETFFTQIEALPVEKREPILALTSVSLTDAQETFAKWKSESSNEASSQMNYCRSLAYTLRDLCVETLDLLGYTGNQIVQLRMSTTESQAAAAAS